MKRTNNLFAEINLIKAEPNHCKALLSIENSPLVWQYSRGGNAPYSIEEIDAFIARADTLAADGQERFLISDVGGDIIGTADLYDYKESTNSAYLAILIYPFSLHGQGFGKTALKLLIKYAFETVKLSTLYAQIDKRNGRSIALFTSLGFAQISPELWAIKS